MALGMRVSAMVWRFGALTAAAMFLIAAQAAPDVPAAAPMPKLHYAPNDNFDRDGRYTPAGIGFNLADLADPKRLAALPDGARALVWVGMCEGITPEFLDRVTPFLGNSRVFGFFLMDDPDPRPKLFAGKLSAPCEEAKLREESDWLHARMPAARTLVVLMNLGDAKHPSYGGSYRPEHSHIDLFALSAYPCRAEWDGCDYTLIDRYVAAAQASGIPRSGLVPQYQAFGGGMWKDDAGARYILPTPEQESAIIRRWQALVPNPILDMTYSWGSQRGDSALELENVSRLRRFFSEFMASGAGDEHGEP